MTEASGGVTGTVETAYWRHAKNAPARTSTRVATVMAGTESTGSTCSWCPVTGSSHVVNAPPMLSRPPMNAEPTASTIIGTVISLGASCGCWSLVHRSVCLLYTSDAADDLLCVDLGGRRIIK